MPIFDPEFLELTAGLDIQAFWAENDQCVALSPNKPRCALSFSPDDHWLFEFLGVESTLRYYADKPYRDSLHHLANELTAEYVGAQFFEEDTWQYSPKRIENLFGCEFSYIEGSTPWLTPATADIQEFQHILDRAERTEIAGWAFPDDFLAEWENRKSRLQSLPALGTGSRGPATIMTSILHPETVFYWLHDYPEVMRRFRDLLAVKMIELNRALRTFSGHTDPGWWITDDNCALFNLRLYREYCVPVLRAVLDEFAPLGSYCYQHSDSAMGHLLDEQRALGINSVNYGPEVDAALIRAKIPEAVICGQMPPFLLRNGSPEEIRARVISDFQKAGQSGRYIVTTAGSLAAGTGLGRMRFFMSAVQQHCRYDRTV
jgi:uroporphyrinogen decarboxylase